MKETHWRSMAKAVSWRSFGTLSTMLIAYLFTHKLTLTLYIGVFEFFIKIILFYLHERLWGMIPFGLAVAPVAENIHLPPKEPVLT
ncbi:MAG: hypothetical protein A3E85_01645 [Gammaproteobacteria bacterium RIFCSPHIGHO2_12_FULL_45_12]|nr:MAG: hypothetical protein A3E85_01645 [Gammaproteobacteria bacterium RIFCSPHIGHO2_12_FULL_45_12]